MTPRRRPWRRCIVCGNIAHWNGTDDVWVCDSPDATACGTRLTEANDARYAAPLSAAMRTADRALATLLARRLRAEVRPLNLEDPDDRAAFRTRVEREFQVTSVERLAELAEAFEAVAPAGIVQRNDRARTVRVRADRMIAVLRSER